MRLILLLLFISTTTLSNAQSKKEQIQTLQKQVETLTREMGEMNEELADRDEQLDTQKRINEIEIKKLTIENAELRKTMRGYILTIDSLITVNQATPQLKEEKNTRGGIQVGTVSPDEPKIILEEPNSQPFTNDGNGILDGNPFGNGGNDSQGYTNGVRDEDGPFQVGSGSGTGNGGMALSNGTDRKIIKQVTDLPDYNRVVKFAFKLTIDNDGNVVNASVIRASTTTTDQILINKVLNAIRKQLKYNKDPRSHLSSVRYNITLQPQ